jgi:hypothetical protein
MISFLLYSATLSPAASPIINSIVAGDQQITINFSPAESDGGQVLENYQYSLDEGENWITLSPVSLSSPIIVSGLVNGATYIVGIRSVYEEGFGPNSFFFPVTLPTTPSAPTITSVSASSNTITINFTPGFDGGQEISNYEYSIDDGLNWVARSPASTTSPIIVSGISNGSTYEVRIRAVNLLGSGNQSNQIVANLNFPAAPTLNSAEVSGLLTIGGGDGGGCQITFSWDNPENNGGSPFIGTQWRVSGGEWSQTGGIVIFNGNAIQSFDLPKEGLAEGTFVSIRLVNEFGPGEESNSVQTQGTC